MIIDFHVHAFADEIAEKAVVKLAKTAQIPYYTDGTIGDTRKKLTEWGVDYGVLLPIATKPTQQVKINNWAAEQIGGNLIPFGTVHPYGENVGDEIERAKSLGLKGIKIHPDYQGVFLFDEKFSVVYERCEALGLPLVIHMGYDPVSPTVHHAMPSHLPEILDKYPKIKLVAAHLGGVYAFKEFLHYVAGRKNCWIDTAYAVSFTTAEEAKPLILKHGIERTLFASDCPWNDTRDDFEFVKKLGLSDSDTEKILHGNAEELLELSF